MVSSAELLNMNLNQINTLTHGQILEEMQKTKNNLITEIGVGNMEIKVAITGDAVRCL